MRTITVYVVSSGVYSDYGVNAIFSSRKLAEEFISAAPDPDYNTIEEYPLNPPTSNLIKRGYSIWQILMLRDGTTERIEKTETKNMTKMSHHWLWKRTTAMAFKGKGIPDVLNSMVWAKTEKQAIKIVNEKRTQMIANNEWKGE